MVHLTVNPRLTDESLENVGHNDEEVRGERITLP
jgi:hypothetical protein